MTKSIKKYDAYIYLFVIFYIIVNLGFYKSYFSHYKEFNSFSFIIHFHGAVLAAWFILLIIQPILIKKRKIGLHRKVGILGHFLVPTIIFSIHAIAKMGYLREIAAGESSFDLKSGLISIYLDCLYFGVFYSIAIILSKNVTRHIKYMIAGSLVLFGPAIGRFTGQLFGGYFFAFYVIYYYAHIIVVILWGLECAKTRKFNIKNDYLFILLSFILYSYLYFNGGKTMIWYKIANAIVDYLY